jgi:hypothetical protein
MVARDEDYGVPQTGAGQRWLRNGTGIRLDDPGMVVLADVMAVLDEGQDTLDDARDLVLYLTSRLRTLYGVRDVQVHLAA